MPAVQELGAILITTLHLANAYHPASGGIRTFYHALLDAAPLAGRRVVLVVPGEKTTRTDLGAHACLYTLRAPAAPAFDRRYRLVMPHRYWPYGSTIARILRAEQPSLVEISDKYTLPYIAALIRRRWFPNLRRPALVGLSHERFDDAMRAYLSDSGAAKAFTRWYLHTIYGPPFDVHFTVSAFTAAELREALPERRPDFVQIVPMGVGSAAFGPDRRDEALRATLLERAGGTGGSRLLFYAGRVSPEKNIGLLMATLRELARAGARDYRLVIAGAGPALDRLLQTYPDMASRVHCCGHLETAALAAAYASADVFVHPNPREPFGIGPLEAMASGVPVVLPDSGGVLEYASNANAWLAPPTAAAFAAAIAAALDGDSRPRVAAARVTAAQFSWAAATRRYFGAYDAAIARFAAPLATYGTTLPALRPFTDSYS